MYKERSILSADLMNLAKRWIQEETEMFAVIRLSHSAGGKEYYFFNDFDQYKATILKLPPMADICIFRKKQLTVRAIADKNLKETIKAQWAPDREWMIAKFTYNKPLDSDIWYEDERNLAESFEKFHNELVAIGPLPGWWESNHADMQSGLIPIQDGTLTRGIY